MRIFGGNFLLGRNIGSCLPTSGFALLKLQRKRCRQAFGLVGTSSRRDETPLAPDEIGGYPKEEETNPEGVECVTVLRLVRGSL